MNMMRKSLCMLLVIPFLLTGCDQLGALFGKNKNAMPPARTVRVSTVELKTQTINIERELTGRTTASRWAEVRPEVGGILKERCFVEGSHVTEGETLYRIEPDTYAANLDSAKANLASAEANLEVTRLKARRTSDMWRTKSVSQQDYDNVNAALKQAQAAVLSAKAAVRMAEINLRRTEVKAPISGRIGKSAFTAGALLSAGNPIALTTIYQTDPIYVELSQSAEDLAALKKQMGTENKIKSEDPSGVRATLIMQDGKDYLREGHLNFAGVDVDKSTNTILLRAVFPNDQEEILPGLFVRTRILLGVDRKAVLAPQKAVLRDTKGLPYVYLLKDGTAVKTFIRTGHSIGTDWYVPEGLHAGDKVILHGVHNVRHGMKVQEVSVEEAAKEASAGGKN